MDSLGLTEHVLSPLMEVESRVLLLNLVDMADFGNELPGITFDFEKLSFVIAALCKVFVNMGNHLLESSA